MKKVELKFSYDRSLLIPIEEFSNVMKLLDKCTFALRNNIRVDGEYKTFYQLGDCTTDMQLIEEPTFVTEWPMSDWEREQLDAERAAQAAQVLSAVVASNQPSEDQDSPKGVEYYDQSFCEAGSND